jgi:hypothetical protein
LRCSFLKTKKISTALQKLFDARTIDRLIFYPHY